MTDNQEQTVDVEIVWRVSIDEREFDPVWLDEYEAPTPAESEGLKRIIDECGSRYAHRELDDGDVLAEVSLYGDGASVVRWSDE